MSEKLIYALSTKAEFSIEQFNDVFQRAYVPSKSGSEEDVDIDARRQVIRVLDSLGYCEFDYDSRKISMCPPSLIILPTNSLCRALFVGSRTPSLVRALKAAIKKRSDSASSHVTPHDSTHVNIPASIQIEAIDLETLKDIAQEVGLNFGNDLPAAWQIINFSASVREIISELQYQVRYAPNWKTQTFNRLRICFSNHPGQDNSKLLAYKNPTTSQFQHWLWNGDKAADIDKDWGRYIIFAQHEMNVLLYDERSQKLAVPSAASLPCLFARALALCSGRIPLSVKLNRNLTGSMESGYHAHVYSDVPKDIATVAADKLEQSLIMTDLKNALESEQ